MPPVTFNPKPFQMTVLQWDGTNAAEMKDWCIPAPEADTVFLTAEEKPEQIEDEWTDAHVYTREEWVPVPVGSWMEVNGDSMTVWSDAVIQSQWKVMVE